MAADDEGGSFEQMDPTTRRRVAALLISILLIALCGITYELIIGTVSSYLLGNSVYQFSLTIGLYLSAMGLGSYLSKFVRTNLLEAFFWVELGVGVLGGVCSALLFGVFTFTPYFSVAMWVVTIALGMLVGLEIPLLTRYIRRFAGLREVIASVLSWDYIGALVGSISFPLLLLPAFGLLNSAAAIGLVNVAVAAVGIYIFRDELRGRWRLIVSTALAAVALVLVFAFSGSYERFLDRFLYQDAILYKEQTPYQTLVMTGWRNDIRLFINGNIQFSSVDEHRYHEALVHPAMQRARRRERVLILGGGDGLAVRQVLTYPEVQQIVLVDLDPGMTRLGLEHPLMRRLNEGVMHDPRVEIVNADAMSWLHENRVAERFDVILIDLPDPNNESLAKLYSVSFYRLVRRALREGGTMTAQSAASYFSPNAFWSIHRTIEAAFCPPNGCAPSRPQVLPYHVWVPSFGDWGFNLASTEPLSPTGWDFSDVETRFLTADTMGFGAALPAGHRRA